MPDVGEGVDVVDRRRDIAGLVTGLPGHLWVSSQSPDHASFRSTVSVNDRSRPRAPSPGGRARPRGIARAQRRVARARRDDPSRLPGLALGAGLHCVGVATLKQLLELALTLIAHIFVDWHSVSPIPVLSHAARGAGSGLARGALAAAANSGRTAAIALAPDVAHGHQAPAVTLPALRARRGGLAIAPRTQQVELAIAFIASVGVSRHGWTLLQEAGGGAA